MIHWLQLHKRWTLLIAAVLPFVVVGYWIYEREVPTLIDMATYAEPTAHPGEEVKLEMAVRRDLSRSCSVRITREISDSAGARKSLGPVQEVSAEGLSNRERLSPGRLILKINLPESTPSGHAHILTEAAYRCPSNPTTLIYPIGISWDWPVTVLPPVPKAAIVIISKDVP